MKISLQKFINELNSIDVNLNLYFNDGIYQNIIDSQFVSITERLDWLLRKKSKHSLLFAILSSDDPSFEDILHKVSKSPSTTSWNISGLVQDGIIERVSKDRKRVFRIKNKELLRKTLHKEFSKLFHDSMEHDEDVFLSI